MSKPKHPRLLADTEAQAIVSDIRVFAAQAEPGRRADPQQAASAALATLTFSKRRIAKQVKKALESAIANAENNHRLDVDRLVCPRRGGPLDGDAAVSTRAAAAARRGSRSGSAI